MKKKQIYSFITIAFLCLSSISCASKPETQESVERENTAQIAANIAKADELFRRRDDVSNLREAVKLLAQVRNLDRRNYEVEWKYAKYNYFLGKMTTVEDESAKVLDDGAEAGRIASRIAPDKPDGYFWYGANLGEQARRAPLTKGLMSVGDIQTAMNKVIEIQPDYQGASAYDILAQIELVRGLAGGDPKKAVEYLEKAIKISGDNSYLRLHLAEAYLADNRKPEAKKQLEFILNMKPNPDFLPEYKETTEKAQKLLTTRF